jgi:peptidoglycan/LPS O-acetylase OafA/YrhL
LLLNELETAQKIHFANFYRRRARRLLPALAFTFLITSVGVYVFFSPENLVAFGGSLTAAALLVSNFLFWYESGYFDLASHVKPLLHTWSLSVEEQFYMFWPLVLWALVRGRLLLIGIIVLFAGSFLLNYLWVANNEPDAASAMFFLTPFRVFEFTVGALCVLVKKNYKFTRILQDIGFLLGVVLITYSMVTLEKSSVFPYINALPVCFGTALLILTGESFGGRVLLSNAPALIIGKLSYSIYLMHWPVYVFAKYLNINTSS